jgi:hypothetical protein
VLTVLGAAVLVSSFGYGILLEGNRVGPGFLPMVLGVLLVLLSGTQLARSLRWSRPRPSSLAVIEDVIAGAPDAAAKNPVPPAAEADERDVDVLGRTYGFRVRQLRMVVAAIAVAIVLVPYAGFLLAFGALVLFIAVVVEGRSWLAAIAVTLAAVGVVYGVFAVFLNVPLPTGLLTLITGGG